MHAEKRKRSSSSSQGSRRQSDRDLLDKSSSSGKPSSKRDRRQSDSNLSDKLRASEELSSTQQKPPAIGFPIYSSDTERERRNPLTLLARGFSPNVPQQTSRPNNNLFSEFELDKPGNVYSQEAIKENNTGERQELQDHSQGKINLLKVKRDLLEVERIQKRAEYIHPPEKKLTEKEINTIYSKFEAKKRSNKIKEIVGESHLAQIAKVCKKHKYIIAIRETGPLSIKRIEEGAKAKPHNILEKSIKQSSVKRGYEKNADEILAKLKEWDLNGFVGHWGANHELIGIRIDKIPNSILEQLNIYCQQEGGNEPYVNQEQSIDYVPLKLNEDGGGLAIKALKRVPEWKTYLYTGDYDLHEAYKVGQGQIPEATKEKVALLNNLNKGIENRPGEARLKKGKKGMKTVEVEGDYAMFQHSDQATYRMNQHLEARALERQVAKLARTIATESNEPLAWCNMGNWFVTLNGKEHDIFRQKNKLTKPHVWSDEEDRRMAKRKTEGY